MKRPVVALAAAALLLGVVAGPVAAGVQRNQMTTTVYHLAIGNGHTWTLVFNGCDGSISATGSQDITGPEETITATLSGTTITFHSVYVGGWAGLPYSWDGTFPVGGGALEATDSNGGVYSGFTVAIISSTTTAYANHGDFVSAMGGGDDAAHSCIGMPVQAQS